jgi:1-deoxy-D-xylulose-5-phosphate reductoisomerase
MRLPISLGLEWPRRVPGVGTPIDWTQAQSWTFEPLDEEAFPAVALAKRVGEAGGVLPAVFNAANEEAVLAFHAGRIGFLDILAVVQGVLDEVEAGDAEPDRATVLDADRAGREAARRLLDRDGPHVAIPFS